MQLYSVGTLPEYGAREVTEHLARCGYCRNQLADVKRFLSVVGVSELAAGESVYPDV